MSVRILVGDCRARLAELPAESVHCVVSSPPYWRQRDYGQAGQIGLEKTPEQYVEEMRAVFAEVRRVLRSDGSLWLNIGDKWASGGNGGGGVFAHNRADAWAHVRHNKGWRAPPAGYKDKDLVGVPWMVAFALRADGWYLRQCNIWAKPNCMPESVTDRSTAAHEYVFHLTKSADYFYDLEAARTPAAPSTETRLAQDVGAQSGSDRAAGGQKTNGPMKAVGRLLTGSPHGFQEMGDNAPPGEKRARNSDKQRGHSRRHAGFNERWDSMPVAEQRAHGANLRSVWWISPAQYSEGHYAVMPERLAEICIAAGSPRGGGNPRPLRRCRHNRTRRRSHGPRCNPVRTQSRICAHGGGTHQARRRHDGAG